MLETVLDKEGLIYYDGKFKEYIEEKITALDSKKIDKTSVATSSTLGLVKSGTDITVDASGNVSVNNNSHKHIVSNISDLTATASELNVLDGITASTTELNYVDGVTSNIQTQLNAKAPLASPTLTGKPKAPTATSGTNTTQIATTAFVQNEIGNLINGAPETANTLKELSELIEEHQDVTDALNAAIGTKANQTDFSSHIDNKSNPHGVTKVQVGLGNVPNVATNNQTPSYTEATTLSKLSSGEKLSVAFGKISKAVTDLISHVADSVKHITSTERTNWNDANSKKHTHGNKTVLDNTTASYTSEEKTKLSGIATGAEVNQNAFSNVVVGSTTISADSKTDNLTLVAGSNVTITPDATNDKITISSSHPTISKSTNTTSTASPNPGGTFTAIDSVKTDSNGHVTTVNTKTVTLPSTSVIVDSALSSTSTNPVQNKVVNTALTSKAPKSHASTATTYGAGTSSNYGHIKLSDAYTASAGAADSGVAASSKAVADAYNEINSNLNVCKSGMNDLRHLGTFYAKTTAQTFDINNISGYKTLVFIGMDDSGTLQLDSVFVPTRSFKTENIGVSINCYALQNYRGVIVVRYVTDTSIVCQATEIMGWSEVGFRVYGMI